MQFKKITPNLVVKDVGASLKFYEGILGMKRQILVPDEPPFVFASVTTGDVEIFFNQQEAVTAEHPASALGKAGWASSMYVEVEGLTQLHQKIQQAGVAVAMPMRETFYGMQEFAISDPDGFILIFAERKQ
ncbi:MAG TPA: VOC family protein [Candidatus Angelobacter sp.]|nr:VOC family protein [Candidatus Angelobacter sp.]